MSKHFDSVEIPQTGMISTTCAALESFAQYRKAEKPTRREELTELGGHLNTLNASCKNNNRPVYTPEPVLV